MAAPRRRPYGSAAIPTSRNDGNSIDRPTAAYNCVDRSPRAETQRTDARIHGNRSRLARDVHRKDLGSPESVRLLQEDREEPVKRGESAEQQKDTHEIHPQCVRKSHLPSPVERVDVVKDADRQISTALDAGMDVRYVNLPAIHAHRRFTSPDLNEKP